MLFYQILFYPEEVWERDYAVCHGMLARILAAPIRLLYLLINMALGHPSTTLMVTLYYIAPAISGSLFGHSLS